MASAGEMTTSLNNSEFPLASPYAEDPEVVESVHESITDWILLELYDELTNEPVVSKSVFLRKDGMLVLEDGITTQIPLDAGTGNYYIVLRHRNHLAIATAEKVAITTTAPLNDFTIISD